MSPHLESAVVAEQQGELAGAAGVLGVAGGDSRKVGPAPGPGAPVRQFQIQLTA